MFRYAQQDTFILEFSIVKGYILQGIKRLFAPQPIEIFTRQNARREGGSSKTLVLFDFDGTLTTDDSFIRFLWFTLGFTGLLKATLALFWRFIRLFISGNFSAGAAKAAVLASCFAGKSRAKMETLGVEFCRSELPRFLRPEVLEWLKVYKTEGAQVALVSASPDIWLRPFCEGEALTMICTELAYSNGIFTGDLAAPNCKGEEKARRIRAAFELNDFERIIAFGNSSGDYAMFSIAHEAWLCDRHGKFQRFHP